MENAEAARDAARAHPAVEAARLAVRSRSDREAPTAATAALVARSVSAARA